MSEGAAGPPAQVLMRRRETYTYIHTLVRRVSRVVADRGGRSLARELALTHTHKCMHAHTCIRTPSVWCVSINVNAYVLKYTPNICVCILISNYIQYIILQSGRVCVCMYAHTIKHLQRKPGYYRNIRRTNNACVFYSFPINKPVSYARVCMRKYVRGHSTAWKT